MKAVNDAIIDRVEEVVQFFLRGLAVVVPHFYVASIEM